MTSTCEPHLNNHPDELSSPDGFACLSQPGQISCRRKANVRTRSSAGTNRSQSLPPATYLPLVGLANPKNLDARFSYRYKTLNGVGSAAMFSSIISWNLLEFPACHERV